MSRRTYLAGLGVGVLSGLAGCSRSSDGIHSEELDSSGGATSDEWSRHVRLTPADEGVSDFGGSVALAGDGTTALVSATHHEEPDGPEPGPAYVLGRTDAGWRRRATLVPRDGDWEMNFGWKGGSTALSGDASTALVGADRADDPNGPQSGAAYVFERSDDGWGRQYRLVPDDGDSQDFFGRSVALSDDGATALVGAWGNDAPDDEGAGSAYVFERTDDGWSQETTIVPDDGGAFGSSVTLTGDGRTAVMGAPGTEDPNGEAVGSAHVFGRDGGTWSQQARFVPDDGGAGDFFGGAVAMAGDTVVVGAPEGDNPNGEDAGSAYVFERTDGDWSRETKLVADDGDGTDLFGVAVALSADGTTALLGARVDEDPNGPQSGAAYVFERSDGAWSQRVKLAPADGESHDVFGRSVALAADTALVGTGRGKAYVF